MFGIDLGEIQEKKVGRVGSGLRGLCRQRACLVNRELFVFGTTGETAAPW